jgi:hypothetical protein
VGDNPHDTGALGSIWGGELGMIESVEGCRADEELVDEPRAARIAGSPQFEPGGQNRFQKKYFATNWNSRLSRVVDVIVPKELDDWLTLGAPNWG